MLRIKNSLDLKYHKAQFKQTYQSTKDFIRFIEKNENLDNKNIVDIGCGAGSNLILLAKKYQNSFFTGVDKEKLLINLANKKIKQLNLKNIKFICKDFRKINKSIFKNKIDLILSFHFISFNKIWFDKSLSIMEKLNPTSIAHSSLFFNGFVEAQIKVNDFKKKTFNHYDIFSLEKIINFLKKKKYNFFRFEEFNPRKKIFCKNKKMTGSYTVYTSRKNLIFSGPLYLPHSFIYAKKK